MYSIKKVALKNILDCLKSLVLGPPPITPVTKSLNTATPWHHWHDFVPILAIVKINKYTPKSNPFYRNMKKCKENGQR